MPYASSKQRAYIHAKAAEGVGWAKKFVADADNATQPTIERVKQRRRQRKERR